MDKEEVSENPHIPRPVELGLKAIQVVLSGACILTLVSAAFAVSSLMHATSPFVPILFFALLSLVVIAVHESGHVAGARRAGMIVLGVQIGPVHFAAIRRGWRFTWKRPPAGRGGYVIAVPALSRSFRDQYLAFYAGGPVANIAAAGLLLLALPFAADQLVRAFVDGLSAANLLCAIANLIPTQRTPYSDGMGLLTWYRGRTKGDFSIVYAKVMGRLVSGTTADQLPDEEVALIERQPLPTSLFGFWLRLKAAQHQTDWQKASSLGSVLDHHIEAMTPKIFRAGKVLIALCRAEIAFSCAMRDRDAGWLDQIELPKSVTKSMRFLPRRNAALRAALTGNIALRDRLLGESARFAADSVDASLEKSEALIRQAILDLGS